MNESLKIPMSKFAGLISFVVFINLIGLSQIALAYHTEEHELITREAVKEINQCFPGLVSPQLTDRLVRANLMEDYNIFNKEIWYSHYYNPLKKLKMRRYDSAFRINGLAADIAEIHLHQSNYSKLINPLGHLIHHLQDATVPPHVVPVTHATADGFETFQIREPLTSGMNCRDIANQRSTDYEMLLRETALSTLSAIDAIHWDVKAQTQLISFPLFTLDATAFWVQGAGEEFGNYGYLGNAFGSSYFVKDGASYYVPVSYYQDFKQRQMSLAVVTSARAIVGTLLEQPRQIEPGVDADSAEDGGDIDSSDDGDTAAGAADELTLAPEAKVAFRLKNHLPAQKHNAFVPRALLISNLAPTDCDGEPTQDEN